MGEVTFESATAAAGEAVEEGRCVTVGVQEEQCVICRVEFENGETLKALPCNHHYHSDCIQQWLNINKVRVTRVWC